jgi:hypothetical protein
MCRHALKFLNQVFIVFQKEVKKVKIHISLLADRSEWLATLNYRRSDKLRIIYFSHAANNNTNNRYSQRYHRDCTIAPAV